MEIKTSRTNELDKAAGLETSLDGCSNQANSAEEYKVGFKNPPRHTQFKKGVSGNIRGRPKGSKNKTKDKIQPAPAVQKSHSNTRRKSVFYNLTYPHPEHCTFDDVARRVTIFGPISATEEREWINIEKRQSNLKDDIIWLWDEINRCDNAYVKADLQEMLRHTHNLIADDTKRKQKFRRCVSYEEFRTFQKQQRRS